MALAVIVGDRISDGAEQASVWAYDESSNFLWRYDTGHDALDVVLDSSDNVYISGRAADNGSGMKNLWKLNSSGILQGGRYVRSAAYAWDLALDSLGRIIVGTGDGAARVAADLSSEEVIASSGTISGVAVDLNDNSIYLGSGGTPVNLRKYSSELGAPLWQKDPSTSSLVTDIAIMSNQRVVISMNYSAGKKIVYSWDKDGNNQLDYDGGITTNADSVAVDSNDNAYVVTNDTATKTFVKLNSSLVEQGYVSHGVVLRRVRVAGGDDKPYAIGRRKGSVLCWKYQSGLLDDAIQCPTDETEGIAISNGSYIVPDTGKVDYYFEHVGFINFQGTNWRAQTFTASEGYTAISVKLGYFRQGSPGNTIISLRATDGEGKPTGADLASITFDSTEITTLASGEWREFILVPSYPLVNGTKYAIVMGTPTGDVFNRLLVSMDSTPNYPDGACYESNDSGSSWTIDNARELNFETIKQLIIAPTITSQSGNTNALSGQQINLFAIATGVPAPTYQWYKNEVALPGETNSTLTIYPTTTATYKCKASNIGGDDYSGNIIVTVYPNPYRIRAFSLYLDQSEIS